MIMFGGSRGGEGGVWLGDTASDGPYLLESSRARRVPCVMIRRHPTKSVGNSMRFHCICVHLSSPVARVTIYRFSYYFSMF